jgi:endonuclease/exonuclease/phosphatase family metal-dependent hydrolase
MRSTKSTLTLGLAFLILFQLIADYFQSVYGFGLLKLEFTPEVATIVLIFSPLLLLFFRKGKGPGRPVLLGLAFFALVCRAVAPLLPLSGRLVLSGLGMAALLVFFPAWLAGRRSVEGTSIRSGFVLAILLSILFRVAGSGTDVSVSWPIAGPVLALLTGWLLWGADLAPEPPARAKQTPASFGRLAGLAVGLASVFLVACFAFTSPTVIARWTGYSYLMIVSTLIVALVAFAALIGSRRFTSLLGRNVLLAWNGLFVMALVLTILPHQIVFPANLAAYPLDAPAPSPLGIVPLVVMLILSPVLALDLALFAHAIAAGRPSLPRLGGAFGLAALFFLVMIFLHVFTTIYDYAPVVGPLLRDRFWLVYLLAGLGMALPILLARGDDFEFAVPAGRQWYAGALGLLVLAAFFVAQLGSSHPLPPGNVGELRLMTYNIQQGFDFTGRPGLDEQLAIIRQVNPDVLGLQESDTARVSNGNVDAVRYFADRLGMYSYYGPTTTTGTFGIALLSRFPIENPQTFFMYSSGEQTAAIHAQIDVNGKRYHIFVTHLGNGGPMVQAQNVLERVQGNEPVIVMGDFNIDPGEPQYVLITSTLNDAWLQRWPDGTHGPKMKERIDHFFLSPGISVLEAEYILSDASDHPSMYIVIEP